MYWIFFKFALSAALLVAASELGRRSSALGALLISLPLVSVLGMVWLYTDTQDTERVAQVSSGVFWLTLPSLPMFLLIPLLLRSGWPFYGALATGIALTVGLYGLVNFLFPQLFI